MRLIATRSSSILSKAIRWATDQPASHFAIVFDERFVFHSNLLGAHPEFYTTFRKKNDLVDEQVFNLTLEQEESVYQAIVQNFDGKQYDFGALLFAGLARLSNKLFKTPLPKKNKWSDANKLLCTEIFLILSVAGIEIDFDYDQDFSMVTAYDLMVAIKRAQLGKV